MPEHRQIETWRRYANDTGWHLRHIRNEHRTPEELERFDSWYQRWLAQKQQQQTE